MLEPHPPRRDPRLLLLEARGRHVVYVAIDAWEVRGLGFIATGRGADLSCARVVLQVRPSQIALVDLPPALLAKVDALARTRGIALLHVLPVERAALRRTAPTLPELARQYPELRRLPVGTLSPSLRLAGALLSTRSPSLHRHYVSRLPARSAPLMDA